MHGRKIRLIVEDNQYQVPRAVQAANKLINRDKIFLMAGALGTPQVGGDHLEQLSRGQRPRTSRPRARARWTGQRAGRTRAA